MMLKSHLLLNPYIKYRNLHFVDIFHWVPSSTSPKNEEVVSINGEIWKHSIVCFTTPASRNSYDKRQKEANPVHSISVVKNGRRISPKYVRGRIEKMAVGHRAVPFRETSENLVSKQKNEA